MNPTGLDNRRFKVDPMSYDIIVWIMNFVAVTDIKRDF